MRLEHYRIEIKYDDDDGVWYAEATRDSILAHGATPQEALEKVLTLIPEVERINKDRCCE